MVNLNGFVLYRHETISLWQHWWLRWWNCFMSNLWAKSMCSLVSCSLFTSVSLIACENVGIFATCMGLKKLNELMVGWKSYITKVITNCAAFTVPPSSCPVASSESFLHTWKLKQVIVYLVDKSSALVRLNDDCMSGNQLQQETCHCQCRFVSYNTSFWPFCVHIL